MHSDQDEQLRERVEQLRDSIFKSIISIDADQINDDSTRQMREKYAAVRDALELLRQHRDGVSDAKSQLETKERDIKEKERLLSNATKHLFTFSRPLGQTAFIGFVDGHVANEEVLAERIKANDQIEKLRREYESLTPDHEAGFVAKTKAKAQQLVVAGKIKMAELRLPKIDTGVGRSLIESSTELTVECKSTSDVLSQIAEARSHVLEQQTKVDGAKTEYTALQAALASSLGLETIDNTRSLAKEISKTASAIAENGRLLASSKEPLVAAVLEASEPPADDRLSQMVAELRDAEAKLESLLVVDSQPGSSRPSGALPAAITIIVVVAIPFLICLLALPMALAGGMSGGERSTLAVFLSLIHNGWAIFLAIGVLRSKHYWMAFTASLLTCLSWFWLYFSPPMISLSLAGTLVAIPVGVWTFYAFRRPQVMAGFENQFDPLRSVTEFVRSRLPNLTESQADKVAERSIVFGSPVICVMGLLAGIMLSPNGAIRWDGATGPIISVWIVFTAIILFLVGVGKVFSKAGEPSWACIVPVYNYVVMCRIAGKSGWWVLLLLIPIVNIITLVIVFIGIAHRFGKGTGFGLGLAFLGFIFWPILGFGSAQSTGTPSTVSASRSRRLLFFIAVGIVFGAVAGPTISMTIPGAEEEFWSLEGSERWLWNAVTATMGAVVGVLCGALFGALFGRHVARLYTLKRAISVVASILLAWVVWSLIPPGTVVTAPIYAHLKSHLASSHESFVEALLKKHGVKKLDDLSDEIRRESAQDGFRMVAKIFSEVTPPSVDVDDSASAYVIEAQCGYPEPGGTIFGNYLSFPITVMAKQALPKYEHKLSFKAYDPSDVVVDTGDLSLRTSASQGDKIEAGATLSGSAIWRVYRFRIFYGEDSDDAVSSDRDGG